MFTSPMDKWTLIRRDVPPSKLQIRVLVFGNRIRKFFSKNSLKFSKSEDFSQENKIQKNQLMVAFALISTDKCALYDAYDGSLRVPTDFCMRYRIFGTIGWLFMYKF